MGLWGLIQNYTACNILTGSDFEQVYYLNQFAVGIRLNNVYVSTVISTLFIECLWPIVNPDDVRWNFVGACKDLYI